jgi:selenide,water dikinase
VLVGLSNADDAGVYRITDDIAMVLTADFFTPIVDDPYWFGAISAANSLSDVYAMGGKPLVALNLAALPAGADFSDINRRIMQGGIDKMAEAGVAIIGGHTVKDKEPKFGYAVLGNIHPAKILDNTKAKPGDALVLTKPVGTGVISTGLRAGRCSAETAEAFTKSMATLNKRAAEIMLEINVSTATDVTGFGLIGHLNEVLMASKCAARLHAHAVPVFGEAVKIAEMGMVPGGTRANQKSYDPHVEWAGDISATERVLMNDAQTSGGLLIFVPKERKDRLVAALEKEHITAAHIGDVLAGAEKGDKRIFVEK